MKFIGAFILGCSLILSGCANIQQMTGQKEEKALYGQIIQVRPFTVQQSEPNLAGAAVGGVAGGVVGNQAGKGTGKTLMTILGAGLGGLVGSQVHKTEKTVAMTELTIAMPDKSSFNISVKDSGFRVGQYVKITQKGNSAEIQAM